MLDIILFDLDGTVSDPKIGITKSVQHALKAIGIDEPDIEKLTPFIGPPLKDMFMESYGVDSECGDLLVAKYRERFSVVGLFENELYDGMKELLEKLKLAGKKTAIATSKPEVFTRRILEYFEINDMFSEVVGSELDGSRVKKIEVIKEAAVRFGASYDSKKAVMVGDRKFDILAAKELGLKTVGVTYGYGGYEELSEAGADYIVDSVDELKALLMNM